MMPSTQAMLQSSLLLVSFCSVLTSAQPTPLLATTGSFSEGEFSARWLHNEAANTFTFEMTSPLGSWASIGFSNTPNSGHSAVDSVVCFSLDNGVTPMAIDGNAVPSKYEMHRTDASQDINDVQFDIINDKQTCRFTRGLRGDGRDDVNFEMPGAGAVPVQYLVWAYGPGPVGIARSTAATLANDTDGLTGERDNEEIRRLSSRNMRRNRNRNREQRDLQVIETYTFSSHSNTARGSRKVNFGTGLIENAVDGGGGGNGMIVIAVPEMTLVIIILSLGLVTATTCYCVIRRQALRRQQGRQFNTKSYGSQTIRGSHNSFVAPPPSSVKGWSNNDNVIQYNNAAPKRNTPTPMKNTAPKTTNRNVNNNEVKNKKKKAANTAGGEGKVEIIMRRRSQVTYIPPPPRKGTNFA